MNTFEVSTDVPATSMAADDRLLFGDMSETLWDTATPATVVAAGLGDAVNALPVEVAPAAADYIPIYDTSEGALNKVLLSALAIGGGVPGGVDTHVQFNDGGVFGGDAGLTYNKATDTLTAGIFNGQVLTLNSVVYQSGVQLVNDQATPAASYYYGTNSAGTRGWFSLPTSYIQGIWKYSSNVTMADPGSGNCRVNAATFGAATVVAFDMLDFEGRDRSYLFNSLKVGDTVNVQNKTNASNWARYLLTGAPVNNTGWFTIAIAFDSGGGVAPTNNDELVFNFLQSGGAAAGGTPGGSDTQVQFNDGGSFGGEAGLIYNKTTDTLTVAGGVSAGGVSATSVSGGTVQATSSFQVASGGSINADSGTCNLKNSYTLVWSSGASAATGPFDAGLARAAAGVVKVTDGSSGLGSLLAAAVGAGASSLNAAAIIQADSTTKGLLPPRMTTTERDAITSPPAGLVVYNTTTAALNVYTSSWGAVGGSPPGGANTQIQYNDGGAFGGDAGLTYNETTNLLTVAGTISSPMVSPSTISANQNDYNPGVARYYRLSTDGSGSKNITGLAVSQVDGQECAVINVGTDALVLKHQDAGSTAGNRFLCALAADITIPANGRADLVYDNTTGRWRAY